MRLSQVASVFLKRRIRPRYIRIKVNAKFPGVVCVAPVPLPVAYSNHRPVETMREGGWGRGRKWELRGTKEERRWKWVNGGEKRIFFFFGDRCKREERMDEDGFEIYIKAEVGRIGGMWKEKVWKNETSKRWERNCSNKISILFCVRP